MKSFVIFSALAVSALLAGGCSPSNNGNAAASGSNSAIGHTPAPPNEAAPTSASATPSTPVATTALSSIWVPGADDKLHLHPVSKTALAVQRKFGNSTAALAEIIRFAPKWFPPKTRVLDVHDDGKTISVNLNRNFATASFWSKSGERTVQLAVYALVNSASQGGRPVALQVEKRPISAEQLNGFDASDAIEPDSKLQANAAIGAAPVAAPNVAPAKASAP